MLVFPAVLWALIRKPGWVVTASIALYLLARHFDWDLPSYPSGVWYFNPFCWQLLFVLGAWFALGGAGARRVLPRERFRSVQVFERRPAEPVARSLSIVGRHPKTFTQPGQLTRWRTCQWTPFYEAIARAPESEMPPVCARDCRVALLSPLPDVAYDSACHEFAFWC
jgi:hypothetical protein